MLCLKLVTGVKNTVVNLRDLDKPSSCCGTLKEVKIARYYANMFEMLMDVGLAAQGLALELTTVG